MDGRTRRWSLVVGALAAVMCTAGWPGRAGAATITAEWSPGISEAAAGGQITVDGYGVGGLGVYVLGGSTMTVCIQADVGHNLGATYEPAAAPFVSGALDYLTWRYLTSGSGVGNVDAAAINVLAWRFADAQRSTGGPSWNGDSVEISVVGVGRRHDIEAAIARLGAEAWSNRGPWTMDGLRIEGDNAAVRVSGPGGPISGVPVRFDAPAGPVDATTGGDGWATAPVEVTAGASLRADATGPGAFAAWSAPGSQRLAGAGSPTPLSAELVVPPTTTVPPTTVPPTTTMPPTTTVPPPTTTVPPPPPPTMAPTTTVPPPTTTMAPTTTVPPPPPPTTGPPPTMAPTTTVPPPPPPTTGSPPTMPPTTTGPPPTTTTTTGPPPTMPPTTTVPPPTTTTTAPPPTTTAPPPPGVASPPDVPVGPPDTPRGPDLPRTGTNLRPIGRIASIAFAAGSIAIAIAAGRRRAPSHGRSPLTRARRGGS